VLEAEAAAHELRLEAASQLLEKYPASDLWPGFERALLSAGLVLRGNLIHAAAKSRNAPIVRGLCDFARTCAPDDCQLVIGALAQSQDPSVEETFIALLARPELVAACAAAQALGAVGGNRSITPLVDLLPNPSLAEVAREALRQVQERTQAGGAGRLSLGDARPEAGAVSIAQPEAGAVSIASEEGPPPERG
jgi:HEAT repeat protein